MLASLSALLIAILVVLLCCFKNRCRRQREEQFYVDDASAKCKQDELDAAIFEKQDSAKKDLHRTSVVADKLFISEPNKQHETGVNLDSAPLEVDV